jgi:hypothetical protein
LVWPSWFWRCPPSRTRTSCSPLSGRAPAPSQGETHDDHFPPRFARYGSRRRSRIDRSRCGVGRWIPAGSCARRRRCRGSRLRRPQRRPGDRARRPVGAGARGARPCWWAGREPSARRRRDRRSRAASSSDRPKTAWPRWPASTVWPRIPPSSRASPSRSLAVSGSLEGSVTRSIASTQDSSPSWRLLAGEVPVDATWTAPRAREWDSQTFQTLARGEHRHRAALIACRGDRRPPRPVRRTLTP